VVVTTVPRKNSCSLAPTSTKLALIQHELLAASFGRQTCNGWRQPQARVVRVFKHAGHPKGDTAIDDSSSVSHLIVSKVTFALVFVIKVWQPKDMRPAA